MLRAARPILALAALASAVAARDVSAAGATSGTVQGVIIPPTKVEPPPSPRNGFLEPIENPIVELRQYDPFPDCFIYLDGGPAAPDASAPPKSAVVWQLESHSFSPPLLPVVTGSAVEIANVGRETHLLFSPTQDGLLPKDPIGPGSSKTISASGTDSALKIQSRSSPHLEGRVVPVPTRYFSRLDRNGKFKIENVPAGRWTIKLWYRDGWATLPGRTVDVPGKDLKIDLPIEALAPPAAGSGK